MKKTVIYLMYAFAMLGNIGIIYTVLEDGITFSPRQVFTTLIAGSSLFLLLILLPLLEENFDKQEADEWKKKNGIK